MNDIDQGIYLPVGDHEQTVQEKVISESRKEINTNLFLIKNNKDESIASYTFPRLVAISW